MTAAIPNTEPATLIAGDTAKWTKTLADYPADESWVLSYELVNASTRIAFTAGADGSDHLVNVAAATTTAWSAGTYTYRGRVTKSGEVYTVATGTIVVEPSFASARDARTHARKTLDAIEATLEGRATSSTAEYEIAGRKLKHIPIPELLSLRDRYRSDVAREDAASAIAAGLAPRGRIQVRFGP